MPLNTLLLLIFFDMELSLADLSLLALEWNVVIVIIKIAVH